jgi:hypothetical protein
MMPSTCDDTFAVCIGDTVPLAVMVIGTAARRTVVVATGTGGFSGGAFLVHAAASETTVMSNRGAVGRRTRESRVVIVMGG